MVWVYDTLAAEIMPEKRFIRLQSDASVTIPGLAQGQYRVEYWDTFEGVVVERQNVTADAAGLRLSLPEFRIDIAAKIISREERQ